MRQNLSQFAEKLRFASLIDLFETAYDEDAKTYDLRPLPAFEEYRLTGHVPPYLNNFITKWLVGGIPEVPLFTQRRVFNSKTEPQHVCTRQNRAA